jgi:hypothetical protein
VRINIKGEMYTLPNIIIIILYMRKREEEKEGDKSKPNIEARVRAYKYLKER